MQSDEAQLIIDLQSFEVCKLCLRIVLIVLLQFYFLYLLLRQLIKTKRYYDVFDHILFAISIAALVNDVISLLVFSIAVSPLSHFLRLLWTLVLYFVFLNFIFAFKVCVRYCFLTLLGLALYFMWSILSNGKIPIRYSFLLLYALIIICAFHQIFHIRQILSNERARKTSLRRFLSQNKQKQIQMQLLDRKNIVQYKVLSAPFRYHLKLRKHFSIVIACCLAFNYYILWDMSQSRKAIGQFLVITIVDLLLPAVYYSYTSLVQWIIGQLKEEEEVEEKRQFLSEQD